MTSTKVSSFNFAFKTVSVLVSCHTLRNLLASLAKSCRHLEISQGNPCSFYFTSPNFCSAIKILKRPLDREATKVFAIFLLELLQSCFFAMYRL